MQLLNSFSINSDIFNYYIALIHMDNNILINNSNHHNNYQNKSQDILSLDLINYRIISIKYKHKSNHYNHIFSMIFKNISSSIPDQKELIIRHNLKYLSIHVKYLLIIIIVSIHLGVIMKSTIADTVFTQIN